MAALSPAQHGEHSDATDPDHTRACAAVACTSALTATRDHDNGSMNRVSPTHVVYLGGTIPPDVELVPPRLV